MTQALTTDYLIIGAGAMGMAFADELVTLSRYARIIMVDRRAKPGGHWNDAYGFVTLHQPGLYYGVNSEKLTTHVDDLSSAAQITAYYERVMDKLCATGRVRFLSECSYEGNGYIRSLADPELTYQVTVRNKEVDATYSKVEVPSTRPPEYAVADGVCLIPINGLADLDRSWSRYVVIGAGKTGIDALLFLLDGGVDPDQITWIISNDCWLVPRRDTRPRETASRMWPQLRALAHSPDLAGAYERFEANDWVQRLDPDIVPTRFRCATVSPEELEHLRRLPHKVRMGRVRRIEATQIVLVGGTIPTDSDVLHIDCTAQGLARRPLRPIFDGDRITLLPVMLCQPAFSSALIAMVEVRCADDASKNGHCRPVPHPEYPDDLFSCTLASFENASGWATSFGWWLFRSRLSISAHFCVADHVRFIYGVLRWMRPAIENLRRIHEAAQEARSGASD
jgi:hypothetical protein